MARGRDDVPVLWHLKVSNYNEKVRWALDYKRIPHRREAPMPGAHMLAAFRVSRRTTLPVLQLDGTAISDSTRIIAALEERYPDPPLYPADPDERTRALELEDYFDENLGRHVRRVGFWPTLDPEFRRARDVKVAERRGRLMAAAMPAIDVVTRRRYEVSAEGVRRSIVQMHAVMRFIEHALDGRDHLVGDRFTVADLTAAALLAPLLVPPQLPYRKPNSHPARELDPITEELRALPAGQWALRMYQRHRPPSAEIDAG
jgi:glutathione S-transferase